MSFRGGKKLLVPFVVFTIVGHLVECTLDLVVGKFSWLHFLFGPIKYALLRGTDWGNLPLWFLLSLFIVQLLYALLCRRLRDGWICLLGFVVACLTYHFGLTKPLYVANVGLGLLAYSMGHYLKDNQYKLSFFAAAVVVYTVTYVFQYPNFIDFWVNSLSSGCYPLAVLFGLSGCVVANNIFKRFPFRVRLLEYVGSRSMKYYVVHIIPMMVCVYVFEFSGWYIMGVMVISVVVVVPLVDKAVSALGQEWVFGIKTKRE